MKRDGPVLTMTWTNILQDHDREVPSAAERNLDAVDEIMQHWRHDVANLRHCNGISLPEDAIDLTRIGL